MHRSHERAIRRRSLLAARQLRGGLAQRVKPDPILASVIGEEPGSRGDIVKRVWAYIKSNGLQDSNNRRMINADDRLRVLFDGQAQVSMFELTKHVNHHLGPE